MSTITTENVLHTLQCLAAVTERLAKLNSEKQAQDAKIAQLRPKVVSYLKQAAFVDVPDEATRKQLERTVSDHASLAELIYRIAGNEIRYKAAELQKTASLGTVVNAGGRPVRDPGNTGRHDEMSEADRVYFQMTGALGAGGV